MQVDAGARLIERLRRGLAVGGGGGVAVAGEGDDGGGPPFEVPVERYRAEAHCARERAALARAPRIATASSAVAPGQSVPVDLPGLAALLVRGRDDGRLRAFQNACRHRGARLLDAPCSARAFVCPYHGWTYDTTGALLHAPHPEAFAGVDLAARGLAEVAVAERHGLVWIGGDGDGVGAHLGGLDDDLAALALERHALYRTARVTRRCNWKLVVEAFLDGYHIRTLHRDSVYRFFLDAASVAERVGPHVRAVSGRRTLRDAAAATTSASPELRPDALRQLATPSLMIFPWTTVVAHPDFVSLIIVEPLGPGLTDYRHLMLVPADRVGEAAHWDKSWELIEQGVFQREDLWICEQVQRSIEAGATERLLFGTLEYAARWFHEALDAALAG